MLYYLDTVIVIYAVEGNPADKRADRPAAMTEAIRLAERGGHPHIGGWVRTFSRAERIMSSSVGLRSQRG